MVRLARIEDLEYIQDLNHQLFLHDFAFDELLNKNWAYEEKGEKYFRAAIVDNDKCCFVAEINGEIVGYLAGSIRNVTGWRNVRQAELDNTLVIEKYRGQGIGRLLAEKFFSWCSDNNAEKILVSAYALNKNAIKFYESLGFKKYEIGLEK